MRTNPNPKGHGGGNSQVFWIRDRMAVVMMILCLRLVCEHRISNPTTNS